MHQAVCAERAVAQLATPPASPASYRIILSRLTRHQLSSEDTPSPPPPPPPPPPTLVSVSTTFHPATQHNTLLPDTILISADSVFFYVHSHALLAASTNAFHALLPAPPCKHADPIIPLDDSSPVLNILLHAIYDISCTHYMPSFSDIAAAVARLSFYGIDSTSALAPATPLFELLLSQAPLYPIDLYTLAASLDLYDLAVAASPHLLSFSLSSLTDEMAAAIGPIYLKRLFFLHFGRTDALKRILLPPPHPHPPTDACDFSDQKTLTRAWALASAYLAWDARPDLSIGSIEAALRPLEGRLNCPDCKQALRDRIKDLVVEWSIVRRTI
ncbi:hypothetical protein H0H81_007914 [Sphagnurus paluster]|uniref:BTB domain-containing protein n=1 Tax=Sphagnurus paluster TaxID=117069 RepID=A0A9P7FXI4_9AGAR|nr:hypothetical protein H0H81_007914 [Sphagnurus paluster]